MLNGRIYRAAFLPLLFALALAGFSLRTAAHPLSSTLAPDAFDGPRAFAELQSLARRFPARRPGSRGDEALAAYVAQALAGLGGRGVVGSGAPGSTGGAASTGAGATVGFTVRSERVRTQTIDGERTVTTVVARRPGLTGQSPIVLLAHRDAAARGAAAELSGTAVLLELARVLAASETQRTILVVSTSGGSGGDGGMRALAGSLGEADAAIALGDLAGADAHKPFVIPYSSGLGSAPGALQRTVAGALAREVGVDPGAPSTLSQFAHLAAPLSTGEQAPLLAQGVAAVLVQASGERTPAGGEPLDAARLESFGRGVLSAVYALDANSDIGGGLETALPLAHKLLPAWAVRLLGAALLLPPLLTLVDGFARARRRRLALARRLRWALACALPFLLALVFLRLLALAGVLAAPAGLVSARGLPGGAGAFEIVLAPVLVLALGWLSWPRLLRRLGLCARADDEAAGIALALVLLGVTLVVWALNPFAALLLLPALHLALAEPGWRDPLSLPPGVRRLRALALVALGALPALLLLLFYARQLALDPLQAAHAAVLLLAGGACSPLALLLLALVLGCAVAAVLVAFGEARERAGGPGGGGRIVAPDGGGEIAITVRGPLTYAGPGSLGGTESALRR